MDERHSERTLIIDKREQVIFLLVCDGHQMTKICSFSYEKNCKFSIV